MAVDRQETSVGQPRASQSPLARESAHRCRRRRMPRRQRQRLIDSMVPTSLQRSHSPPWPPPSGACARHQRPQPLRSDVQRCSYEGGQWRLGGSRGRAAYHTKVCAEGWVAHDTPCFCSLAMNRNMPARAACSSSMRVCVGGWEPSSHRTARSAAHFIEVVFSKFTIVSHRCPTL